MKFYIHIYIHELFYTEKIAFSSIDGEKALRKKSCRVHRDQYLYTSH